MRCSDLAQGVSDALRFGGTVREAEQRDLLGPNRREGEGLIEVLGAAHRASEQI